MFKSIVASVALSLFAISAAHAAPIVVTVGDNDGYGLGIADNAVAVWPGPGGSGTLYDGRSAAEAAAVNGAQFTDTYAALFPGSGGNATTSGDVIFPIAGLLSSGNIVIDMGDFQVLNTVIVSINGIVQPGMLNFSDGFQQTRVRTFALGAAELAAANLAGQVVMNLNHSAQNDYIAFDFFELRGEIAQAPEPAMLTLLAFGAAVGIGRRRR